MCCTLVYLLVPLHLLFVRETWLWCWAAKHAVAGLYPHFDEGETQKRPCPLHSENVKDPLVVEIFRNPPLEIVPHNKVVVWTSKTP